VKPQKLTNLLWRKINQSEVNSIDLSFFPKNSAVVGGFIRDTLLQRDEFCSDIDFIIPKNAINVAKKINTIKGGKLIILDQDRDIARLVFEELILDFASLQANSLEEDLKKRDFTINSIALVLNQKPYFLDPTQGIDSLKQFELKTFKFKSLIEDPARIIRAFRFMSELDFKIEKNTLNFLIANSYSLNKVAPERIKTEIVKLIHGASAIKAIHLINQENIMHQWQNNKTFCKDILSGLNFDLLNNSEKNIAFPIIYLTNILSDQGLVLLRFSNNEIKKCRNYRKWIFKVKESSIFSLTDMERFQLHKELEEILPAIIVHLDRSSQQEWIDRWRDPFDSLFHPRCPVDGEALKEVLGLSEGPKIGALMRYMTIENAYGRIKNYEQSLVIASDWIQQNSQYYD
tara:strand:- start:1726 stop:2931 length:1206 start_codon:yes stop_codon:yes gene_type:complete